jgi:hypothetical protein
MQGLLLRFAVSSFEGFEEGSNGLAAERDFDLDRNVVITVSRGEGLAVVVVDALGNEASEFVAAVTEASMLQVAAGADVLMVGKGIEEAKLITGRPTRELGGRRKVHLRMRHLAR